MLVIYALVTYLHSCHLIFPLISLRYWNDPEVLSKLGQAMGMPTSGEAASSTELSGPKEVEEETGYEDESVVHHTASTGDVEVCILQIY